MSQKKRRTNRWLQNRRSDGFVKRASHEGYRSRAVFKLQEIDHRDHLIRGGMRVVDLGAAPGGWSQYVAEKIEPAGKVVAIDVLAMKPINKVTILRGDFTDPAIQTKIVQELGGSADLVLCDAAPNISGIREVDQANFLAVLEAALNFSTHVLRKGGNLLIKVFEFPDLQHFRRRCEREFKRVYPRKPSASRTKSREYYLIATGLLHTKHRIG